jgi:O-antigen/teichoic acid export membrane protein
MATRLRASLASPATRRRVQAIATHGISSLGLPLLGPLLSLLVIRAASVELWGQFVPLLVLAQLGAHLAGWGNKEYLLREFSRRPGRLAAAWQSNLLTRLALVAVVPAAAVAIGHPPVRAGLLLACCLALMLRQTFDVLVLYRRDFIAAIGVEMFGLLALALPIAWLSQRLTPDALLALMALSSLAKAALLAARYRSQIAAGWQARFEPASLLAALPFFLLGFSGLLQSRIDVYIVAFVQAEQQAATYQVLANLLIFGQSTAAIILAPFVKGLYRLPYGHSLRLSAGLPAAGALFLTLYLPAAWLAMTRLYGLAIPPGWMLLGGLLIIPVFFYLPIIYALFKAGRPQEVVSINFLGAGLSAALTLALLPRMGLPGALLASACAQWAMGLVYLLRSRTLWPAESEVTSIAVPELPRAD